MDGRRSSAESSATGAARQLFAPADDLPFHFSRRLVFLHDRSRSGATQHLRFPQPRPAHLQTAAVELAGGRRRAHDARRRMGDPDRQADGQQLRKSRAFWSILGDHGVPSNILRVPLTFPPEKFAGVLLSAMCVPDLRGTQGSFTYYTTDPGRSRRHAGRARDHRRRTPARRHRQRRHRGAACPGRANPMRRDEPPMEMPFSHQAARRRAACCEIAGQRHR